MDKVSQTAGQFMHSGLEFWIGLGALGIPLLGLFAFFIASGIRINQEWERGVVYFLGRYTNMRGPGLFWIMPVLESVRRVDIRILTVKLETQ